MNRIRKAFENGKAFIGFLTGGDPNIECSEEFIGKMIEAGCDLVEIGIPFSDPIAEGPVIQGADLRALAAGTTTDDIFSLASKVRARYEDTALVVMTYLNPVYKYGYDRFFENCKKSGIDGIIVPDMPFEEKGEIQEIARKNDIAVISMIAPTSEERIRAIAEDADPNGFLYIVSSMGVTGMRSEIKTDLASIMQAVRSATDIPAAIGFGINTPEQAAKMARLADGVIVGSAIVRLAEQYGEKAGDAIFEYVKSMKKKMI
ncbi:MAG: tryptophan synthase subunit alpha [Lachnospiraceae bacterium]|nr:tryptophan synthase subunit alpha [Lachnospiraceae bacterium]